MMKKVHEDCPFDKETMDAWKAELYYINSTNQCINPPAPSWYRGLNDWQVTRKKKKSFTQHYSDQMNNTD